MSGRFGRNQRRRAREEIAAIAMVAKQQENAARRCRDDLNQARQEAEHLRAHMASIASRLSRYAVAASVPVKFETDFLERCPQFRMTVQPDLGRSLSSWKTEPAMTDACIYQEIMRVLTVDCIRQSMNRDMHCLLSFDGHDIGYAISDHALRNMTDAELTMKIGPAITSLLVLEISKARNKR